MNLNFLSAAWFKVGVIIVAFVVGCFATSVYKNSEIKDLKLEYSQQENTSLREAARELSTNAADLNKAASAAQKNIGAANDKLTTLAKQIKTFPPLPADCRPDTNRVRNLREAINITNTP